MQHLDEGVIQELVDGEIASRDLPPLQAHLSSCDACRARLDAARMAASEVDELLLMLDEVEPPAPAAAPVVLPIRRPHWSRNLAWAASLVVAVGLGYASRDTINGLLGIPQVATSEDATAPAVRATPTAPPAEPTRITTEQRQGATPLTDAATASAPEHTATPVVREDRAESPAPAREATPGQAVQAPAPTVVGSAAGAGNDATRQSSRVAAEAESATGGQRERRAANAPPAAQNALAPARQAGAMSLSDAAKAFVVTREVDLPAALRILGGSIKLIDGMVPLRLEATSDEVRVIYEVMWGDLVLSQRRVGERIEWELAAPASFPADSLTVLRAKVRP